MGSGFIAGPIADVDGEAGRLLVRGVPIDAWRVGARARQLATTVLGAGRARIRRVMAFTRGDHVCALYSTTAELAREVASFLAEGLTRRERCWYGAAGNEMDAVRAALEQRGIDVAAETRRQALMLLAGEGAYVAHGRFNAESTLQVFNDAIEQVYTDGFTGFRAAADMSWALECEDGAHHVIVYEALLRTLFANCRAIGLCLYDRTRMPLPLLNGVLHTHPVAGLGGHYGPNPFYDPGVTEMVEAGGDSVLRKVAQLDARAQRQAAVGDA